MGRVTASDAELVEASRRGERAAFGELVERYQRVVCAVGYSGTSDRALAEDVAQDTFVAAFRQLDQLRDVALVRQWLCGIARNLARKARRVRAREDMIDEAQADRAGTPFDHASEHERDTVVAAALARLPEMYRDVLVLYYSEHRSVPAVASALGISADTVHQRLSRGRQLLVAAEVAELVEHTLERRGTRRNLVVAVLAALPVVTPSHANASPGGTNMLKVGIAASVVGLVLVGTGIAVHRSYADGSPHANAPVAAKPRVVAGAGPVKHTTTAPSKGARSPGSARVAPALHRVSGAPNDCKTAAAHLAELRHTLTPDTPLTMTGGQSARMDVALHDDSVETLVIHMSTDGSASAPEPVAPKSGAEKQCLAEHWPQFVIDCYATAYDLRSAIVQCTNAPPGQAPTEAAMAAVTDASCSVVGSHYGKLVAPIEIKKPSTARDVAFNRLSTLIPDEIEESCEGASWSEGLRRCLVAATTTDELEACR